MQLVGGAEVDAPLSFRLHTWTAHSKQVGHEVPEPSAIAWDPTGILVALAYPTQVGACVCWHKYVYLGLARTIHMCTVYAGILEEVRVYACVCVCVCMRVCVWP